MALRGANSNSTTALASSNTITHGISIQNGDIVVLCEYNGNSSSTLTFPSGFSSTFGSTSLANMNIATPDGTCTVGVAWKQAGSSEPSSYTVSWTGGTNLSTLVIYVFSGRSGTPFSVSPVKTGPVASSSYPLSLSITGLSGGANAGDDLLLLIPHMQLPSTTETTTFTTAPTGFGTKRNDYSVGTANSPTIASCIATNVSAGNSSGTLTGTLSDGQGLSCGYGAYLISMGAVPTAPQFVQSNQNHNVANVSSLGCTYSGAVTAGNLLVCHVGCPGTIGNTFAVSDTVNGNWTQAISNAGSGNNACAIFYLVGTASGTPTVNVTMTGTTNAMFMVIEEFTLSVGLDQTGSASGASGAAMSATSGGTIASPELVVGLSQLSSNTSVTLASGGVTTLDQEVDQYLATGYYIANGTGAQTTNFTQGSGVALSTSLIATFFSKPQVVPVIYYRRNVLFTVQQ